MRGLYTFTVKELLNNGAMYLYVQSNFLTKL